MSSNKPSPVEAVLTNENVLEMVKAGVAPSVIVSQIRSSKTNFNLSKDEVIRLSKAGVPEAVILAMGGPAAAAASGAPENLASDPQRGSPFRRPGRSGRRRARPPGPGGGCSGYRR